MRKVLITGGTGGIGVNLAESFIKRNYFVILMGRDKSKIDNLVKKYKNIEFYSADFFNNNNLLDVLSRILEKYKSIDILINNIGITQDSLFMRMSFEKWSNVIQVNLNSNFLVTNFFIKTMIKNRWGRVINITSVVCHTGNAGQTNYCSSKSGIIGLSKSLALEVAKRGITVNCISPGFIDTKMTEILDDKIKSKIVEAIPIGKIGKPTDVSNCALFLAAEESDYITGQTLHVNGGLNMI